MSKVDIAKIICKINYNDNYFRKMLHHRCLTGFWVYLGFSVCQGSKYTSVLNITNLNMPLVFNVRILNETEFWICHAYTGFWIYLNNSWIYQNIANMPKCAWRAFVLHVPIVITCLLKRVVLFSWGEKISFFLQGLRVFDLPFVLD